MPATQNCKPGEKGQAHELAERSGIPFPAALRVVRGEATLDQVLKQLLRQEIRRNLETKGLPPPLAGQVASGHLGEAKAWETFRAMQNPAYSAERSALDEALAAAQPILLERFSVGTSSVTLIKVEKYEIAVADPGGGEPIMITKHDIKWMANPDAAELIEKCRSIDRDVVQLGLSASAQMLDRITLPRACKLDLLDGSNMVRCITRTGDVLEGRLTWSSRYELGLRLAAADHEPHEITIFLHALLRIEDQKNGKLLSGKPEKTKTMEPGKKTNRPRPGGQPGAGKKQKPGQKHFGQGAPKPGKGSPPTAAGKKFPPAKAQGGKKPHKKSR